MMMNDVQNPTRRVLLKIGAVAPLAALMPAALTAATPAAATLIEAAAATPAPVLPAWGWWAGQGGEGRFSLGPFLTRDEAVAAGRRDWDGAAFDIVEAVKGEPSLRVDGDDILEMIDGRNEDHHDPDGDATIFPGDISREARKELGDAVSAIIAAWVERHKVQVQGYMFDLSRNDEFVPHATPTPSPRATP